MHNQFDVECIFDTRGIFIGNGWGKHFLLPLKYGSPCTIVSYGLSTDVSFEEELSTRYNCTGLAMDPTVDFGGVAARTLEKTAIKFSMSGAPLLGPQQKFPEETSVPEAISTVSADSSLSVLKMDCEGCEYAVPRDSKGKNIFNKIEQFAVELHIDRRFLQTSEHMEAFESLLGMLDESGLEVSMLHFTGCGEDSGDNLAAHKMTKQNPDAPRLLHHPCIEEFEKAIGHSCRLTCVNVLFSRNMKVNSQA
ncbi:hypothetical protein N9F40_01135 [bacterium]|nr:hypothetical protein [bacterium]